MFWNQSVAFHKIDKDCVNAIDSHSECYVHSHPRDALVGCLSFEEDIGRAGCKIKVPIELRALLGKALLTEANHPLSPLRVSSPVSRLIVRKNRNSLRAYKVALCFPSFVARTRAVLVNVVGDERMLFYRAKIKYFT